MSELLDTSGFIMSELLDTSGFVMSELLDTSGFVMSELLDTSGFVHVLGLQLFIEGVVDPEVDIASPPLLIGHQRDISYCSKR